MKLIGFLEQILSYFCKLATLLLFLLMFIISYEVIMRYAYNSPTTWAWILNLHFWLVTMLLAGVFAFQEGSHIRIEVLYDGFNQRMKAVTKYLTLILFWFFVAALVWKGYSLAALSAENLEIARGPFPMPIYPFKIMMPIAGVLMFFQGTLFILRTDTKTGLSDTSHFDKEPVWLDILSKVVVLILFWTFTLMLTWRWIQHTIIMGDNSYNLGLLAIRFIVTISMILISIAVTKHFLVKSADEENSSGVSEKQLTQNIEQKER